MNKCVNIIFMLLYSDALFEGRDVYVQTCKIKEKTLFRICWFVARFVEFVRADGLKPEFRSHVGKL